MMDLPGTVALAESIYAQLKEIGDAAKYKNLMTSHTQKKSKNHALFERIKIDEIEVIKNTSAVVMNQIAPFREEEVKRYAAIILLNRLESRKAFGVRKSSFAFMVKTFNKKLA